MTTKAEALKVLSTFGEILKDSRLDITLQEFIEKFLAYARVHNAKKTVDLFRNAFDGLQSVVRNNTLREIVLFAVFTGLRRGEILNLMWKDIDLEVGVILVQSSPRFKTKHGRRRIVPLSVSAAELLNSKLGQRKCDHVFSLNGKKVAEDWVTHLFKRYVRKACLPEDRLHFHSLRHTFASWLVQSGATLYEVQRLLGHSSSKVTEIYSHLQPEQMHSTVNKIMGSMN